MTKANRRLRFREASQENWNILLGLNDPDARKNFVQRLREREMVIFRPRPAELARIWKLMGEDEWFAEETDPAIMAEVLARKFPEVFLSADNAYSTAIDWRLERSKHAGGGGSGSRTRRETIPPRLIETFEEDGLVTIARRKLRQEIKHLNRDPIGTIAEIEKCLSETADPKNQRLLAYLVGFMHELAAMEFPAFKSELVAGLPFPSMHVRVWIRQIKERGNALIAGDVGTQKTSAAILGLHELGAKATVVLCRSYARDMVWGNEIGRYYRAAPDTFVVRGVDDIDRLEKMTPDDLRRHRYLVVGYGGIQSGRKDEDDIKHGARLLAAIARLEPDSVIIDEAHAIKGDGERSSRVLAIAKLPSVRFRVMLTATPFENNPNEAAHIATLLDPASFPSEEVFVAQCRANPRVYFALMASRVCDYFTQEDVLDLPPSNYSAYYFFPMVELPCSSDLEKVSAAIRNDGTLDPRQQVFRLTRLLAVPLVGKGWYPKYSKLRCFAEPLANPKLAYLKSVLPRLVACGKVVVASGIFASGITRQVESITPTADEEIASLIESWYPGQVLRLDAQAANGNGGTNREMICADWRKPEKRIMVVSVPSAAESLNFSVRKSSDVKRVTIFWLGLPWKPTMYMQFNGRFLRPGTEVPVDSFVLAVNGTADYDLLAMNERKWLNFLRGMNKMPILEEEEAEIERAFFGKMVAAKKRR